MIFPYVDMVIAVHDRNRPIQRAAASLLASGLDVDRELRVTIVCHNVATDEIGGVLDDTVRSKVRLVAFADGIPSPAGPFMHGITMATAEYVGIMGSDDFLEPGALAAWLHMVRDRRLVALIPPLRHASGPVIATPLPRPGRVAPLHPVKDRLAYRAAPLGLLQRDAVDRLGLTMPTDLRSGEDQLFGLKLWFSRERIGYGRGLPHYVIGDDAATRVTLSIRTVAEDFRAIDGIIESEWFMALPIEGRRSIAVKTLRVNVFSAVLTRTMHDVLTRDDRLELRALILRLRDAAPRFDRPLSVSERRLAEALVDAETPFDELRRLVLVLSRYRDPASIFTANIGALFAADAPLRRAFAARSLRRSSRKP